MSPVLHEQLLDVNDMHMQYDVAGASGCSVLSAAVYSRPRGREVPDFQDPSRDLNDRKQTRTRLLKSPRVCHVHDVI
jgi:hypothetical protein